MIFTMLRIQTELLVLVSLETNFKAVDCFLEVIKSRIFNELKLTLLNRHFLGYLGLKRGCRYSPLHHWIKSIIVLLHS